MDVIEVVTNIETSGDYGMQIEEVATTFHVHGKCVGCAHSMDSYCRKHRAWGYNITDCSSEPKIQGAVRERTYATREVYCQTTDQLFDSLTKAGEHFGITPGQIHQVCIGKHKHTHGKVFMFADAMEPKKAMKHARIVVCKATGEQYDSIKSAARTLNIPEQTFRNRLLKRHPVNGKIYEVLEAGHETSV